MFRWIGNNVVRYWPIVLAVWVLAVAAGWLFAPTWEAVTRVGEAAALPESSPSVQADHFFRESFPLEYTPSNVIVVAHRDDGVLTERDQAFLEREITAALVELATTGEDNLVNAIRSPADRQMGALLVSPDKKAALVLAELTTPFQDARNPALIGKVEDLLARARAAKTLPPGLQIGLTGSATAGRDLTRAEGDSVAAIEIWTLIAVVALLLILYRAPLVAILPLVTVFLAVATAMPLLTWLSAKGVFSLFQDLRIFITVLAYGAGVDYCLFLIARYREELAAGEPEPRALANAIGQVGGAITASAATVIGGIAMLAFAQFAKIQQAGIVIPFALGFVLLGTLTAGAALLRLAGRWAFWPQRIRPDQGTGSVRSRLAHLLAGGVLGDLWGKVATLLLRRPGTIWLATVLLMSPFAVVALQHADETNFNPLGELPAKAPSTLGTHVLAEHFPPGAQAAIVVVVQSDGLDFSTDAGVDVIARLTERLMQRKASLGLADVRSIAAPLGFTDPAKEKLGQLRAEKKDVDAVIREDAMNYYVSQIEGAAGRVTRLEATLDSDPLASRGIDGLRRLEKALLVLLPEELSQARIELAGATASLRDLSDVKQSDERLIQILVPVVVFLLLLALFRRVVVSIYLIVSVLFSYYATLGLTYLVFRALEGDAFIGLDWKVPIFLFTILVAVGEDYNIFLLARVQEELGRYNLAQAITISMSQTGSVISSCGFIMAGTFASLLSGSLSALQELGFALAVGVLVDTLIVRPILVPAFLILIQQHIPGRWGNYMALGKWESRPSTPEPVVHAGKSPAEKTHEGLAPEGTAQAPTWMAK